MQPKLFDIHSHLNFKDFDIDRKEVIQRALDAGIWMINTGSDYESSKKAVEIAEKYKEGVYAAVGLHPAEAVKPPLGGFTAKLRDIANHPKVVSIGECGLDLHKVEPCACGKGSTFANQIELFKRQIELAVEMDKPLMIHCRDAHQEVLDIVSSFKIHDSRLRGNIHFFSGTWEQAQQYFALGFTISFTGVITFANQYDEIIKKAPLDKIMIETDAPFVAPLPWRGQRNEPLYVQEVAKRIAKLRGLSYEKVAEATAKNALKFFRIVI